MHLHLISIGKIKEKFFIEAEDEYLKRLSGFPQIKITQTILPSVKPSQTKTDEQVKNEEGQKILSHVREDTITIVLDVKGKEYSSEGLAQFLKKFEIQKITLIIGGHLGLSDEVLQRADYKISLSPLTFTHQMVQLILFEQLYRSMCIVTGKKYHR